MGIQEIIGNKRQTILELARKHGAFNVRVFGSVARGEATEDSDVDFLVQFREGTRIWDVIGLQQDLAELLQREVNLSTDETLKEFIRPHALKDAVPL
ncbi:MAG: nucleotidyltransferase family protein [Anaerolineae bacterium]|nr:nucleotidyltransferase family protein [Anaerolineae bacterium]